MSGESMEAFQDRRAEMFRTIDRMRAQLAYISADISESGLNEVYDTAAHLESDAALLRRLLNRELEANDF